MALFSAASPSPPETMASRTAPTKPCALSLALLFSSRAASEPYAAAACLAPSFNKGRVSDTNDFSRSFSGCVVASVVVFGGFRVVRRLASAFVAFVSASASSSSLPLPRAPNSSSTSSRYSSRTARFLAAANRLCSRQRNRPLSGSNVATPSIPSGFISRANRRNTLVTALCTSPSPPPCFF